VSRGGRRPVSMKMYVSTFWNLKVFIAPLTYCGGQPAGVVDTDKTGLSY